jgi:hypothetical protein
MTKIEIQQELKTMCDKNCHHIKKDLQLLVSKNKETPGGCKELTRKIIYENKERLQTVKLLYSLFVVEGHKDFEPWLEWATNQEHILDEWLKADNEGDEWKK